MGLLGSYIHKKECINTLVGLMEKAYGQILSLVQTSGNKFMAAAFRTSLKRTWPEGEVLSTFKEFLDGLIEGLEESIEEQSFERFSEDELKAMVQALKDEREKAENYRIEHEQYLVELGFNWHSISFMRSPIMSLYDCGEKEYKSIFKKYFE